MNNTIFFTISSLSIIGTFSAVILFIIAKKFHVIEDPKIDEVEAVLPLANCGGCGYPGCRAFAEAIVKQKSLEDFYCPVGGNECLANIAKVLGIEHKKVEPQIAVIRCNGSIANRKKTTIYDGEGYCSLSTFIYSGDTDCQYGCLGLGDCVKSCQFNAMKVNPEQGLPEISEEDCVACGACVKACPKGLIELRKKGPKSRRIFVSCTNREKGGIARKACKAACIGCSKCVKECPFEAITLTSNLAYIDFNKCKLCRKCVTVCPTNAIWEVNFPPKKQIQEQTNTNGS